MPAKFSQLAMALSDKELEQQPGLENVMQYTHIHGEGFALGHNDDHSSFQSKLTGIYLLLLFLHQACHPNSVQKLKFQLACMESLCYIGYGTDQLQL